VRRGTTAAVAALTALGGALRLATLGVQSYWYDEAVTVGLVRRSFGSMLGAIPHSESTPPLYYALAWPWARVFGTSGAGLRSLSAVVGTATIPLAYWVVARLGGRRAGLAAAALAACNPLLIWYSQEARAYALLVGLCAASLLCFVRVLEGGSARWAIGWAATSAAALATHYFALFPVAGEALWLLARGRERRAVLWAVGAVGVVGCALLPLAVHQRGGDRAAFIANSALSRRLVQTGKQFLVGYRAPGQAALTAIAAASALLALALLARAGAARGRRGAAMAGGIGLAAVGVPVALALVGVDFVLARNLLAAWLPLMAVVALGAGLGRPAWAGGLAAAGLCAAGLVAFALVESHRADQRTNWRGAARALGPPATPRLVVSDAKSALPLALYLPGARPLRAGELPVVGEIDLVGVPSRVQGQGAALQPSGPVPPGFAVVPPVATSSYRVQRWRAPAPRVVPAAVAAADATDKSPAGVLYEP
jgi:mannosyltransferase